MQRVCLIYPPSLVVCAERARQDKMEIQSPHGHHHSESKTGLNVEIATVRADELAGVLRLATLCK